ncbi:PREDICTED: lipase 3-like isoform X2 [Dufourea novaeangliae]|nr:PREDICTED: lipase 3-like isoform X2 [Dufourea novaeangliae]
MKGLIATLLPLCIFCTVISGLDVKSLVETNEVSLDPDANDNLDTLQMIRKEGYEAEAHVVETEDGYLLTVHRIPGASGSPAVYLQHGVLGSSADWVILGKGKALAYLLADQGYDVWLGNFRGNTYSRAHIILTPSESKFWDFSWHESGIYDLPAMITYIVDLKKSPVNAYIGFSMGTTCFYVMASERPEETKLLQSVYNFAPVVYMKHVESPLRYFAPVATDYKKIFTLFGEGEFLPQNFVIKFLAKSLCNIFSWQGKICANAMFVFTGFDAAQFNYTLLPTILNHTPAGTSAKTMVHYAQEIRSGYFRQYDYGKIGNLFYYNSFFPPAYNLSRINIPIVMFSGENDWLSNSADVNHLKMELPYKPVIYKVPFEQFNHVDFLWAVDAPKLVYTPLLAMMKSDLF